MNAQDQPRPGMSCPVDHDKLADILKKSVKPGGGPSNGGLDNNEWAAVVDRQGVVCAVAYSGGKVDDQWLGSRAIAAEKANTANAFRLVFIALLVLVTQATAAISPTASHMHLGRASVDLDRWQRIDFRLSGLRRQQTAEIKFIIRTKDPSMQSLIRIPGAPASNFDTGNGSILVDLINVSNDASGYADIASLEILFTHTRPVQFYEILAAEDGDQVK